MPEAALDVDTPEDLLGLRDQCLTSARDALA
jgi:hypothetical protein